MDFKDAAKLGALLAKDHAERMFELLVKYRDISSSEAASRLGLHIRTAQDFLEGLAGLEILGREEVYEKKRPYYRYTLKTETIAMNLDLAALATTGDNDEGLSRPVRERRDAGARFTTARSGQAISAVTAWTGRGRDRKEHRIKLTAAQGAFLFHLPFPDAEVQTVQRIMDRAEVGPEFAAEVLDLVEILDRYGVLDDASGT